MLNALWAAETTSGRDGRVVERLPHEPVLELLASSRHAQGLKTGGLSPARSGPSSCGSTRALPSKRIVTWALPAAPASGACRSGTRSCGSALPRTLRVGRSPIITRIVTVPRHPWRADTPRGVKQVSRGDSRRPWTNAPR